ncbi:hypothetical protein BaOVIS_012740 [Babesia ovis]|uniref:Uncharacterized protein n=1 Tax=Babesia ovis TaxID=5869 RepID=A0A9W5TAE8_BABOV|nr:hypothetical protein BaOVIS_012740 [Babesia ovis]
MVIAGIGVGVLVLRPFVHISVSKDLPLTVGTWYMKLESSGRLVTGGEFNVDVSFYNTSIFPLTFKPSRVTFYHYPIGSTAECLKCNYIEQTTKTLNLSGNVSMLHKEVLEDTTDGLISLQDLVVKVPPKTSQSNVYTTQVPIKAKFEIHRDDREHLGQLKPLYLDCKKHGAILLSMRIEGIKNELWFIKTEVPAVYEVLIPLACEIGGNMDDLFLWPMVSNVGILANALNMKT